MRTLRATVTSLLLLWSPTVLASPPGVWMLDTWSDTGLEPDPATASQPMWQSPYIWVRNTNDGFGSNEHMHQNPIFGQTNYVYVKLEANGEETLTGDLELYYAQASTGLDWSSQWTLFATVPVSLAFTQSFEVPWDPPGTGHYCMVARFTSPQDPTQQDTLTSIDAYTRVNNNVVWRNLNIVDQSEGQKSQAWFIIRNIDKDIDAVNLVFRTPEKQKPYIKDQGRVFVRLDPELYKRWMERGAEARGVEKVKEGVLEVVDPLRAELFGLPMKPWEEFKVQLDFLRNDQVEPGVFQFDAVQYRKDGKETGGVGYQIRTIPEEKLPPVEQKATRKKASR